MPVVVSALAHLPREAQLSWEPNPEQRVFTELAPLQRRPSEAPVDRLFREPGVGRGHVVDWISLFASDGHIWPIFNLADSAIVCGAVLAAVVALLGIELDGSRGRQQPARGQ